MRKIYLHKRFDSFDFNQAEEIKNILATYGLTNLAQRLPN